MTYKTILVHCDDQPRAAARIKLAIDLARRHDAHLVGMAVVAPPQLPVDMMGGAASGDLYTMLEQSNRARLAGAKATFERETKAAGLPAEYIERVDQPIDAVA